MVLLSFLLPLAFISALSEAGSGGFAGSLVLAESELASSDKPVFQKGISYVGWSNGTYNSSDSDESLALLAETNTEWVAICVFWYQTNLSTYDIHADPERTPTNESVAHAISQAHNLGLKVMLKPMIDPLEMEGTHPWPVWRGEIPPSDEWFASYANFINFFADFAEQNNVELFSVGCELKGTTQEKQQWENIISGVREHYSGPITYAADGSNYQNIEWWSPLDYVGIDAYFPLSFLRYDPAFEELKNNWAIYADEIEAWQLGVDKPVIFTEIGYRSGDGTNMAPGNYWIEMSVDLQEQVDCYEAAFQTLWNRSWFYGFYWWNWETDPNAGGSNNTGYTPQNKPTQNVVTNWYSLSRHVIVIDQSSVSVDRSSVNESQSVEFHASWEHNDTDVAGASVYVNGTGHVTNGTGWISFSVLYDTVGKRLWAVTNVYHSEASCYKKTVDDPYIVWDKMGIKEIDVDATTLGTLKVRVTVAYAYDETPVIDATTLVNGQLFVEIEPGVYAGEVSTWSPFQTMTVYTGHSNFAGAIKAMSVVHVMNVAVYFTLFTVGVSMIALFVWYVRRRSRVK